MEPFRSCRTELRWWAQKNTSPIKCRGIALFIHTLFCYQRLQPSPTKRLPRCLEDPSAYLLRVSGWWPTHVRVAVVWTLSLSISSWTAHWSSLLTLTAVIFTPAAALILWGRKKYIWPSSFKTESKNKELEPISPFLWEMQERVPVNGFPSKTKSLVIFTSAPK